MKFYLTNGLIIYLTFLLGCIMFAFSEVVKIIIGLIFVMCIVFYSEVIVKKVSKE